MSPSFQSTPLPQGFDIPVSDWQRTPTTVQSESSRPPSTDSAAKKHSRRKTATERRKPGAKPGYPGHRQVLLEPTTTISFLPEPCGCGQPGVSNLSAYHTHQVIELPVIRPEVTHWRLHQGQCLSCGKTRKSSLPTDRTTGYGPRLMAFVGEMTGIVSISRSAVQDVCASVFRQ
jgi:transposase